MGATIGGLGGSAVGGVGIIPGAILGGCMGMVAGCTSLDSCD